MNNNPSFGKSDSSLLQQSAALQDDITIPEAINQARKNTSTLYVEEFATLLKEPHINGIRRLVEIFGVELIQRKVDEALQLFKDAEALGLEAYTQPDTAVSTNKSRPRTCGGVFFFLMREHCSILGLNWGGLRISPGWYDTKSKKQTLSAIGPVSSSPTHSPVTSAGLSKSENRPELDQFLSASLENRANTPPVIDSDKKKPEVNVVSSKSVRLKVTLIGSLSSNLKPDPQGQKDLLELTFKAEVSNSLPKGLPNMGGSKVVVWCTKKQLEKVLQEVSVTSATRFLIEGEPVPAVSADLTPFLRVLCTRLTTVELEQGRYNASRSNASVQA